MKIPSQVWLYKLFNSKYFDTWMAVSYLHRYPCIGIHKYICNKLRTRDDLELVLPQLIHIMFYHTNHVISFPIYDLLHGKSDEEKFALALFFHLRSFLQVLTNEKHLFCKNLMTQILNKQRSKNFIKFRQLSREFNNTENESISIEDKDGTIANSYKYTYLNHPTKQISTKKQGYLGLEGLLVFFVKSVCWNISDTLTNKLDDYEDIFRIKKEGNYSLELNFNEIKNASNFKKNLLFLNELMEITFRLKELPKHIQQKELEIELSNLQLELPAKIFLPFRPNKYILNISLQDSFVLDSAKNSPFVVVLEVANEIKKIKRSLEPKTQTAIFLLNQINNLKNIPDNKKIKENIIEKLNSLTNTQSIKNEKWEKRKKRIQDNSVFGDLKGYEIVSMIAKSGNDFKQELIAYQLLTEIKKILEGENKEIWIKNYEIYLIKNDSGLVETVTNVVSIHNIKKGNIDKKN
ncbi:hypothetical protein H311_02766, partial [Anncaliia algerae PRA109]